MNFRKYVSLYQTWAREHKMRPETAESIGDMCVLEITQTFSLFGWLNVSDCHRKKLHKWLKGLSERVS